MNNYELHEVVYQETNAVIKEIAKTASNTTSAAMAKGGASAIVSNNTQFSKHALERLTQRGITSDMAKWTIENGQKFYAPLNKSINYVLPKGFASGKSLLVGKNPLTGEVTTVLRSSQNLIKNRFILLP